MTTDETPWHSKDYVQPADRPAEWARMATELANTGRSHADIAAQLWVDEPAVARLLAGGAQ